ncbi:hypothetical protein ACLBWP_03555 [Microbacterium sp. M1A1_1b]
MSDRRAELTRADCIALVGFVWLLGVALAAVTVGVILNGCAL